MNLKAMIIHDNIVRAISETYDVKQKTIIKRCANAGIEEIEDCKKIIQFEKEAKVKSIIQVRRKNFDIIDKTGAEFEVFSGNIYHHGRLTGNVTIDYLKAKITKCLSKVKINSEDFDVESQEEIYINNKFFIFAPLDIIQNDLITEKTTVKEIKKRFESFMVLPACNLFSSLVKNFEKKAAVFKKINGKIIKWNERKEDSYNCFCLSEVIGNYYNFEAYLDLKFNPDILPFYGFDNSNLIRDTETYEQLIENFNRKFRCDDINVIKKKIRRKVGKLTRI